MIEVWVNDYILSKKNSWARTSKKNERYRLQAHGHNVFANPDDVYESLKKTMHPHSIKTTLVRLGQFYDYLVESDKIPPSKNLWKLFMKSNAMIFKHAYQIERLTVTFDQAKALVQLIEEPYRSAASQLLEGGLRYCELHTFNGERVIGKGSKPRKVFLREELKAFRYTGSYSALFVRLKAVGLKPHSLRKLCATEFSRHPDVKDQDTCAFFGWNDIGTSIKYRQSHNDERMSEMISSVVNKAKAIDIKSTVDIKSILSKILSKVMA